MKQKDRDNLIILAFILGCIFCIFFFYSFTRKIYFIYVIAVVLLLQTFFVVPKICKLYYEINGLEPEFTRFIPFYQLLTIFTGWVVKDLLLLGGLVVVVAAVWKLVSLTFLGSVIGVETALEMENYLHDSLLMLMIVGAVAYNFLVGCGFTQVKKRVHRIQYEFGEVATSTSRIEGFWNFAEFGFYFLLFLPFFRIIALWDVWNLLIGIQKLKDRVVLAEEENLHEAE